MTMSDKPSVSLQVFFVVALIFTAIGLLECAFIVADFATKGSLAAQRAPDLSFGLRSWRIHHEMRPGYQSPVVRTNSFGLRSPEVSVPKQEGTFRILLLGDSFTFGMRVADDEQIFARRLEHHLRERYPSRRIEVVNGGVLSYCPLLEYLEYRHYLHALEPNLVILNFDMSDVQDHLAYSRDLVRDADGTPLFVTEPSLKSNVVSAMPHLLLFEWIGRRIRGLRGRVESTLEGNPFVRDKDRYLWALDNGPAMDREATEALMPVVDLRKLLDHNRIPLILATYPQPWQVSPKATSQPPVRDQYGIGFNIVHLNDRPFKKLSAFAAEHGLPFVNATDAFRADPKSETLFFDNDFHFTPRGHELYASVLTDFIVGRDSLAESH
jgi:hypothetical protein